MTPAKKPMRAPSHSVSDTDLFCCSKYADSTPPPKTQRQQQLQNPTTGSADNTPMKSPPSRNGIVGYALSVVILTAEMGDQLFAAHETQGVLQLHQLNE